MSHKKLREEKDCLNCGARVEERYCSVCGQENLALKDSAFHLMVHYIQDLFHYDGKFWHTIKNFVTRPGLVPQDYVTGKRQRHLNPIQFYVFASTVFFFMLFIMADSGTEVKETSKEDVGKRLYHLKQERKFLSGSQDTLLVDSLIGHLKESPDSMVLDSILRSRNHIEWDLFDEDDTLNDTSWLGSFLSKRFKKKTDELQRMHEGDEEGAVKAFFKELLHKLPQLLFFSLPFFALFLKLLYFRSEQKSYATNFIFSVYHYAYLFIIFLLFLLFSLLVQSIHTESLNTMLNWLTVPFVLYPFIYLYLSMRRFYKDKGIRLFLRYWTLMFVMFCTMIVLFLGASLLTFIF